MRKKAICEKENYAFSFHMILFKKKSEMFYTELLFIMLLINNLLYDFSKVILT